MREDTAGHHDWRASRFPEGRGWPRSTANWRPAVFVLLVLLVSCAGGEDESPSSAPPVERLQQVRDSIDRGVAFLLSQETPGEGWPSRTYGALRDSASLTPMVAKTLMFVSGSSAEAIEARDRAAHLLAAFVSADGEIVPGKYGLNYPVYTTSLAVLVLSRHPDPAYREARDAWRDYLLSFQLTESLGWSRDDLAYGGWGYTLKPLHKAQFDPHAGSLYDADLSSTLFAIGALRIAGANVDDPSIVRALAYVMNCQNFAEPDADGSTPDWADGGFCFTPTNDLQNKAGVATIDATSGGSSGGNSGGRTRYRSYGSMTADGVRALIRCGLPTDHPRVRAAVGWLERNFDVSSNPGDYEEMREVERDAAYYYYCWTLAHAMRLLGQSEINTPNGPVNWAEALADNLLSRQNEDGTWTNSLTMMKEDDPIISTCFAVAALSRCAEQMQFDANATD